MTLRGLWRLIEPFAAAEAKAGEAEELRRLKRLVEGSSVAVPASA
jgi:hypothetical protein